MINSNKKENIDSFQFPEQFQFLSWVYQAIDFVQLYFFKQDIDRNCENRIEIDTEGLK